MAEGRRSLVERMEISAEIIKKAFELSMKAHKLCCTGPDQYLCEEICSSCEIVFAFPGSWSVNEWFSCNSFGQKKIDLDLFPSLRTIGNQESAFVNEAFVNEAFFRKLITILDTSQLKIQVHS